MGANTIYLVRSIDVDKPVSIIEFELNPANFSTFCEHFFQRFLVIDFRKIEIIFLNFSEKELRVQISFRNLKIAKVEEKDKFLFSEKNYICFRKVKKYLGQLEHGFINFSTPPTGTKTTK